MGTHKICVAVNKRAPHTDSTCVRLWGAVWQFLPAVREMPTRADRAELRAVSEGGRRSRRKPRRFSGRPKMQLTLFSSKRAKRTVVCGFSLTLNYKMEDF